MRDAGGGGAETTCSQIVSFDSLVGPSLAREVDKWPPYGTVFTYMTDLAFLVWFGHVSACSISINN